MGPWKLVSTALALRNLSCLLPQPDMMFSLECPLPFRDNEFDFIHVEGIALGVPENKVRRIVIGSSRPLNVFVV